MTQFVVGLVVGLSLAAVVVIVWAPWKQVRAARPLDETTETRILLGDDPEQIARDLDGQNEPAEPADLHEDWDTGALRALRSLDEPDSPNLDK